MNDKYILTIGRLIDELSRFSRDTQVVVYHEPSGILDITSIEPAESIDGVDVVFINTSSE